MLENFITFTNENINNNGKAAPGAYTDTDFKNGKWLTKKEILSESKIQINIIFQATIHIFLSS